ncbi:MAG: ROK family protein [Elusimicrobiota bacterium]|jgi:glucokinase|nr:ROK family protein [Elusimicrobiota bacterium]
MISIGIDIGGTSVKLCAVNHDGKIIKRGSIKTNKSLSGEVFLSQIAQIINKWKRGFNSKQFVLGVGTAGDTDHKNGVLRLAPNLPWKNLEVKKILQKLTGINCFVSNDANMAAWGIYARELEYRYKSLVIITMGTGIGGGIIIDGKLWQGANGSAGEIGHIKADFSKNAPVCGCKSRGCLESFCGAAAVRRVILQAIKEEPKSLLAKLVNKKHEFNLAVLSEAAKLGDKTALVLWNKTGMYLARGVVNAVLLLNPEAVVLAGGVSRGAKYFIDEMYNIFKKQFIRTPFENLKLLISRETEVGAAGTALYALSKFNEK